MSDFDHARAWREQVLPRVGTLPSTVTDKVQAVLTGCLDAKQGLSRRIELTDSLRGLIESIPEDESYGGLAGLTALIYRYGHWRPSKTVSFFHGVTWKFSNLADQVLRERLGDTGGHMQVHQGVLRATYSDKHGWSWFEIGLANTSVLAWCRGLPLRDMLKDDDQVLQRMVQTKAPGADEWDAVLHPMQHGYVTDLTDKEKAEQKLKELFGDLVLDLKISPVSYTVDGRHQGHPFCITAKHIKLSAGMCFNPAKAPCGTCDLAYSSHKSKNGLHVWVARDEIPASLTARLVSLKDQFVRYELDGVAFHKVDVPKELI